MGKAKRDKSQVSQGSVASVGSAENAQAAVKKVLIAEQKKANSNQSAMIYDQYI